MISVIMLGYFYSPVQCLIFFFHASFTLILWNIFIVESSLACIFVYSCHVYTKFVLLYNTIISII